MDCWVVVCGRGEGSHVHASFLVSTAAPLCVPPLLLGSYATKPWPRWPDGEKLVSWTNFTVPVSETPGSARVYLWGRQAWVKGDPHLGPILLMIGNGCFWAEVWGKASRDNWDQLKRFKSRGFRVFSWFLGKRKPWWRDSWSENTESSEK